MDVFFELHHTMRSRIIRQLSYCGIDPEKVPPRNLAYRRKLSSYTTETHQECRRSGTDIELIGLTVIDEGIDPFLDYIADVNRSHLVY